MWHGRIVYQLEEFETKMDDILWDFYQSKEVANDIGRLRVVG